MGHPTVIYQSISGAHSDWENISIGDVQWEFFNSLKNTQCPDDIAHITGKVILMRTHNFSEYRKAQLSCQDGTNLEISLI